MISDDSKKKNGKKIIDTLIKQEPHLTEVSARDILRLCRKFDKETLEPILNLLCDYGYLKEKDNVQTGVGRPKSQVYLINPAIYGNNTS